MNAGMASAMAEKHRVLSRLPGGLSLLYGLTLAAILCLLVGFQGYYSQYYGGDSLLSNLWLIGIAAILLAAALAVCRLRSARPLRVDRALTRRGLWLLCALYLALFGLQCVIARSLWFYVGFDPSNVRLYSAALALNEPIDRVYFSACANNAPITVFMALPYWVGDKLGMAEPYVMEVYASVLMVNLSGLVTMRCLCRLTQDPLIRLFGFALSTACVLLSPYITVPYTDSVAVLFPVLALDVMLNARLKTPLRYGLAALICSVGAAIKPTVLIVLIAMALLGFCRWLESRHEAAFAKRGLLVLAAVAVGLMPGYWFQRQATVLLAGSARPETKLDSAHYLMIGLDDQYWGGHSVEDLAYSESFATLSERNAANLRRAKELVCGRSLLQNLHFFSVKAYKAYADGTFAWNGSAMMDQVVKRTDGFSKAVRSFYYRQGEYNGIYCTVMQGLWLMILLLACAAAVWRRGEPAVQLISLSLLGLTGYQLLFEVWPRYLFLYAPVFILLAALGLEGLAGRVKRRS